MHEVAPGSSNHLLSKHYILSDFFLSLYIWDWDCLKFFNAFLFISLVAQEVDKEV